MSNRLWKSRWAPLHAQTLRDRVSIVYGFLELFGTDNDDDAVQRLANRIRRRVLRERNSCIGRYKRVNSAQDALTPNVVRSSSSLAMIARATNDRINLASFKRHFAASCLPSCVWNQSLPNLHFSSSFAAADRRRQTTAAAAVSHSNTLPHASSVEYFTPEKNFVPPIGAYCTWSSSCDDQLIEGKPNKHRLTMISPY